MRNKQDYFVRRLDPDDYRPMPEAVYEVQILNADHQGERCAYFGDDSTDILCVISFVTPPGPTQVDHAQISIPQPVIDMARTRKVGFGEYVNEKGEIFRPF